MKESTTKNSQTKLVKQLKTKIKVI